MQPKTTPPQIINGKRYDPKAADLISGDDYWDGHNWERKGRNTFLYRTKRGNYFTEHLTCHQGENDYLVALCQNDAISLYEKHQRAGDCRMTFEVAFPGVEVEDA